MYTICDFQNQLHHHHRPYLDDIYTVKIHFEYEKPPEDLEKQIAHHGEIIFRVRCEDGIFLVYRKYCP